MTGPPRTGLPRPAVHRDLDVDGVLGPHGALEAVLPSYEHRPQQLEMARAVERALARGTALVAEAGTGTGKTLAYLVPAVLSGKRVVISTATRTLQDQLFLKDIPLLRDQVGLGFTAALLKGRSNYLCAHRYEGFAAAPLFRAPEEAVHWPAFQRWAASTETGDRGETKVPDLWSAWPLVSTTPDGCLGGKCPSYETCFVTRARRVASECQVVVVNHALFFADLALRLRGLAAGGERTLRVLPDYDAVIFDEAHALEDVATEYFGQSVSSGRLAGLAQDVLGALDPVAPHAGTLSSLALELKARAERFFEEVVAELSLRPSEGPESKAPGAARRERGEPNARSTDTRLGPETLVASRPAGAAVGETLAALAALCPEDELELGTAHRRAVELGAALELVLRADDPAQVFWAQARARTVSLHAAPIEVGRALAQHLYGSVDSAIFTSATLAAPRSGRGTAQEGASFDYVLERFGLGARPCETVRVESPFDFASQAALYVPSHLPEPSNPAWTKELARESLRLIRLTGGRAFLLFTSLRHLDEVYAILSPHLELPVLKQGEAPRRALIERFHLEPSVLFASQSFWEGVDVPGEALSLVVIDRLPFAPPGEPLQAARMEAVRARGLEPFADYQVPQAALALRQGFGRLIRTQKDRGIVALGDVRVTTRRYGKAFLESLPPAQRFTRLEPLRAWWSGSSG